jgi:hypothetical protein
VADQVAVVPPELGASVEELEKMERRRVGGV